MAFWDGLVGTALVIGVGVCLLYVIISLLMPELGPNERTAPSALGLSKDRWLVLAGFLYFIAVGLELTKGWADGSSLGEMIYGLGRLFTVGGGLAILTVAGTDALLSFKRKFRRSNS
ncbi:hypothetical protein K2X85_05120 [bacterium]|jgi:hypothetical protein|nr:hypothetical protein [bacterium]